MKKILFSILLTIILFSINTLSVLAQCPMCKAAAESNLKEGGTHGLGLNAGIIYLFCTPYILVAVIGGLWWWNNRKMQEGELANAEL